MIDFIHQRKGAIRNPRLVQGEEGVQVGLVEVAGEAFVDAEFVVGARGVVCVGGWEAVEVLEAG